MKIIIFFTIVFIVGFTNAEVVKHHVIVNSIDEKLGEAILEDIVDGNGFIDDSIDGKGLDDKVEEQKWKWHPHWPKIKKLLCSPCKHMFSGLVKELQHEKEITKEKLKEKVEGYCTKVGGRLLHHLCGSIAGKVVDELFRNIHTDPQHLNPEHLCKHVHLC